jgi:two-component system, chemotaxis family, protein-glutamate methylesterase/glutaminase
VEALQTLARKLPADFPAAVFVVLHVGARSYLASILDRAGPLPAASPESGEVIRPGRIYVAPPDVHMLLHGNHVLLRRGPRENMSRPAIDPLFRSAAATYGARVIGAVLTGALSDGASGLLAVKRCGGLAVVQDPKDATVPEMPLNALRYVAIDRMATIADMADALGELVRVPPGITPEIPENIRLEAAIAAQENASMETEDRLGTPSHLTCPECHGTLWEIADGTMLRYRCHVGHAFSADTMVAAQSDDAEQTLWGLLRSYQERIALLQRMVKQEHEKGNVRLARRLDGRAHGYRQDVETVNRLLRGNGRGIKDDPGGKTEQGNGTVHVDVEAAGEEKAE